jgi:hypothetical protein
MNRSPIRKQPSKSEAKSKRVVESPYDPSEQAR